MVFFVDLEGSGEDQPPREMTLEGRLEAIARRLQLKKGLAAAASRRSVPAAAAAAVADGQRPHRAGSDEARNEIRRNMAQTAMTKALACYP